MFLAMLSSFFSCAALLGIWSIHGGESRRGLRCGYRVWWVTSCFFFFVFGWMIREVYSVDF